MTNFPLAEPKRNAMMLLADLHLDNFTEYERIEYEEVLKKLENMNKTLQIKKLRELITEIHPYSINHSENSGWYTDVKDCKESKRRKIKKSTEESLLFELAKYYNIELPEDSKTIRELFPAWYAWKQSPKNVETMRRYSFEWKSYYEGEPLSQSILDKSMKKLTKQDLRDWAESLIRKHNPDHAKFTNMFAIMNQIYRYAEQEDLDIGDSTVWDKAKRMINKDLLADEEYVDDCTQVFTDEERLWLQREVRKDLVKYEKQASGAGLQILFMLETALRPGEACGLKFSDVDLVNRILHIRRQANNERVKAPKKKSYRDIPLTDEAINLINEIIEFNTKHNFTADWIFQSNNPNYEYRLSYNAADRKLRKLCHRMNTEIKSPHKLRKTALSVICDTVNVKTAQRFAGHKDVSTTIKHYDFDRTSKEEQAEKINQALSLKAVEQKLDRTEQICKMLDSNQNLNHEELAKLLVKTLNIA